MKHIETSDKKTIRYKPHSSSLYFKHPGFTIVELLIVIVIIGILAGISITTYNGIQIRASENALKASIVNSARLLEKDNLDKGSYPVSDNAANSGQGLPKSSGLSYQYTYNSSDNSYCLTASINRSGVSSFFVRNNSSQPQAGACPGHTGSGGATPPAASAPTAPAQPVPSLSVLSSSSIRISWNAVTGADSYVVKYGTTTLPSITLGCVSSPCTLTGLNSSTTYYANVTASNASGNTTSTTQSATTSASAPVYVTPPAPSGSITNGRVSSYTASTVTFSWDPITTCPAGSSAAYTLYHIHSSGNAGGKSTEMAWTSAPDTATSATHTAPASQSGVRYNLGLQPYCIFNDGTISAKGDYKLIEWLKP